MNDTQRAAVLEEAKRWEGTPYHHRAALIGCGADCALWALEVYRKVLPLPALEIPAYAFQWWVNQPEEIFLECVLKLGAVEVQEPQPGDFALYRTKPGRPFAHGAIVLAWPEVLHAVIRHGVIRDRADRCALLDRAEHKFFSFPG